MFGNILYISYIYTILLWSRETFIFFIVNFITNVGAGIYDSLINFLLFIFDSFLPSQIIFINNFFYFVCNDEFIVFFENLLNPRFSLELIELIFNKLIIPFLGLFFLKIRYLFWTAIKLFCTVFITVFISVSILIILDGILIILECCILFKNYFFNYVKKCIKKFHFEFTIIAKLFFILIIFGLIMTYCVGLFCFFYS